MSDELQCSKCGLVSDRERRSLADDPQAERAWRCNNFRTAYLESSPILADRMAFCARGHSDENGHHGDEDGCGWVVLRAAEGGTDT